MKLRNKKTGEVFDVLIREKGGGGTYSIIVCDIKAYNQSKSLLDAIHSILGEYSYLAELNEEWEDYEPAEPLIKDEKIRKAVRAWAEANDIGVIKIMSEFKVRDVETPCEISFWHNTFVCELVDNSYTITELCGEEK